MHYYPHHIGDYQRDTAHLSMVEHGAYRLLMDSYYVTEKCLPLDAEALHRICRAMSKTERSAVDTVAAQFFTRTDKGLIHNRIESEVADYHKQAETNRVNGRKGGRPPNGKPKQNPLGSHSVSETLTETKGNQEPRTNNHSTSPDGEESPAAPSPVLALPFDSAAFAEAWGKWKRHRSEIRKPLKPTMEAEQLAELAAMGEPRAVACLLHTIAKGWQGLREPDPPTPQSRPRNAAYDASTATAGLTPDQVGKF